MTVSAFRWWQRLEPYPQDLALERSLEARVHDAAWMLARQWQFGEFRGENTASPIAVRVTSHSAPLTDFRAGPELSGGLWEPYRADVMPVETLVEREPATLGRKNSDGEWIFTQLRQASRAGQHLLRLLYTCLEAAPSASQASSGTAEELRRALQEKYTIPDPSTSGLCTPEAVRHWKSVKDRIPDGVQMRLECLEPGSPKAWLDSGWLPVSLQPLRPVLETAVQSWLEWWGRQLSEPEPEQLASTWVTDRLEYDFSLSTKRDAGPGSAVFHARSYDGARVDWSSFDLDRGQGLKFPLAGSTKRVTTLIPQPLSFAGMPLARFWSFEDEAINFAAVEMQEDDLARLALIDFMLLYGNDWFLLPLRQTVGNYHQLEPLEVFDAFGGSYLIDHTGKKTIGGNWSMFQLSNHKGLDSQSGLLLVPSIEGGLEGRPVEEVRFCRDELANLAWAVEERVEGVDGRTFSRHEHARFTGANTAGANTAGENTGGDRSLGTPAYHVVSPVPEHWIPLVPVRKGTTGRILLRRAQISMPNPDGVTFAAIRPEGRLLTEERRLDIREEEVPRSGIKVTRAHQFARWSDGSAHLWLGRRRRVGGGETSSQFGWDVLIPPGSGPKPPLEPSAAQFGQSILDFTQLTSRK